MNVAAAAHTALPWMWLVSRASGLLLLVAVSAVMVLGISAQRGDAPRGLARFATVELHRTLSLFAVMLLVLHVLTSILDPFVSIGWWATFIPFLSHYRTGALAAGTLAVDCFAAVIGTSLLRRRIGHRAWRATHWLAYVSWPLAVVHTLTAGSDMRIWWFAATVWGAIAAVGAAIGMRVFGRTGRTPGGSSSARLLDPPALRHGALR